MTAHAPHRGGRMTASRLEAFSDGVIAIIVTIMVIELRPPEGGDLHALRGELPVFLAYVLSFQFVAVYWNNHHHLLRATEHISASVMWANMFLLFWLSLVPFATAWVGQQHEHPWPAAVWGIIALLCGCAYTILFKAICLANPESLIARTFGVDRKGILSIVVYAIAVALAFLDPWISYALYAIVNGIWFIPDRRLEHLAD